MNDLLIRYAWRECGVKVTRILGGFHVKDLDSGKCVDVMAMLFNWRVVRTDFRTGDTHVSMDRGWCYQGTGVGTFLKAVRAAHAWDGEDDTEPEGFIKIAIPVNP